jgi:Spy/CpxP family protein refolding chaperone
MTKKATVLAAAVLMVFAVGVFLAATPAPGDMMKHARFGLHMAEKACMRVELLLKFKDEIALTPDQVGKIEKMRDLFSEAAIKQQADIEIQELRLHSLMAKDPVDRKTVEKMIRDISKLKTDLQIDRMNYLMDVKATLTPEQIKKIEALKKDKMHDRMRDRHGMMKEKMREKIQERRHMQEGEKEK